MNIVETKILAQVYNYHELTPKVMIHIKTERNSINYEDNMRMKKSNLSYSYIK